MIDCVSKRESYNLYFNNETIYSNMGGSYLTDKIAIDIRKNPLTSFYYNFIQNIYLINL